MYFDWLIGFQSDFENSQIRVSHGTLKLDNPGMGSVVNVKFGPWVK